MAAKGWRQTTVGKLCDEGVLHTQTGPFGSQLHSYDYVPSGVPVVPTEGIGRRRLLTEGIPEVAEEIASRLYRHRLKTGDILFARRGVKATGLSAIVTQHQEGWLCGTGAILLRTIGSEIDPEYLSFFLSSDESIQWLRQHAVGAVMPNLNEGVIRQLLLTLPPLAEQKAIASVLGALDDKIELNRQMNSTLEAMAREQFQSWFVDFSPVRAKVEGKKTAGLDATTAALFSSQFQDSPLGPIPHGWIAGNFGMVIAAARERVNDAEAVVLSAVSSSELVRSDDHFNKQVYSKSISNYLKVRRWDFAYNPSRINIGSVGMLKENIVGAVSPVYEVFRPTDGYHWFVERALAQPDVKIWIQSLCSGSVRQSLKLKNLESIPCVIPPLQIVQAFNRIWESWHELIYANEDQSRTLETLRDNLMPKLLSGDIRVANVEEELASV